MRPESSAAALVRLRLTHQVPVGVPVRGADALAVVEVGPMPAGTRVFVPGLLPCGECPACRRALCSACVNVRRLIPGATGDAGLEVPERFLVAVDDGALPATSAIAAGLVADIIGAAGRAGLGPGDTAIWLGRQPWVRIGAAWSMGRGCRTFFLSASPPAAQAAGLTGAGPQRPVALEPAAGLQRWNALIAESEAAGGPAGGRPERRIFVCGAGPDLAEAAVGLATPGSTLSFLLGTPATIEGLDRAPPLRLLTGSGGHPDLVTEALAALRRREVDVEGAFVEVTLADHAASTARLDADPDRPIPIVVLNGPAVH